MTDLRDGERLPDIRGKQAYRQPDGRIALWGGEFHVMIGPKREGLREALTQLKLARGFAATWRQRSEAHTKAPSGQPELQDRLQALLRQWNAECAERVLGPPNSGGEKP